MAPTNSINKLNIDIETRAMRELKRTGAYEYASCSAFDILLFAYKINDGETLVIDIEHGEAIPGNIMEAIYDVRVIKRAWNAQFERVCISRHFGMPPGRYLNPVGWFCTMVEATAHGLPAALGRCAAYLGLDAQKMNEGKALIKLFCVPQKVSRKRPQGGFAYASEFPAEWQTFRRYVAVDVDTEHAIEMWLRSLPNYPESFYNNYEFWKDYWLDQHINDNGVPVNKEALTIANYVDNMRRLELEIELQALGIKNPNSPVQIKKYLEFVGYPTPSFDEAHRAEMLKDESLPPIVRNVVIKSAELLGKASQKAISMQEYAGDGDRLRGTFQYNGAARTGRWSGRGPQLQNLKRNDKNAERDFANLLGNISQFLKDNDNVRLAIGKLSRNYLQAPQGKTFAVIDFSAIEARVLAWLAGERWVLDVFESGRDIYIETATRMFGVPFTGTPPRDDSDEEKDRYDKEVDDWGLRPKGKVAVLALGYQGGKGALAAMDFNNDIPEEQYEPIKKQWREANPLIVQYWADIDRATKYAYATGQTVTVGGAAPTNTHNEYDQLLEEEYRKRHHQPQRPTITISCPLDQSPRRMHLKLPSGRQLHYHDVTLSRGNFGPALWYLQTGEAKGGMFATGKVDTHGGKIVENITQAVANDLLRHLLRETHARVKDIQLVMHVHDEIVALVDETEQTQKYEEILSIARTGPAWANGLPLDGAGFLAKNYKK